MPLWVLRSFVASTPNGVTPESATADELGWISIESPRERHYAAASRETSSVTCDGAGATGGTLRPIKEREDTRSNRCAAATIYSDNSALTLTFDRRVDGRGYHARRWSNSKAQADWSSGSADRPCSAPVASHDGGPRAVRSLPSDVGIQFEAVEAPRFRTLNGSFNRLLRAVPRTVSDGFGL